MRLLLSSFIDMPFHNPTEILLNSLSKNADMLEQITQETKEQLHAFSESQLNKLGVVSREEFDALRRSLNRAMLRIEELEKRLQSKH